MSSVTENVAPADDLAGDQPSKAGHRRSLSWLGAVPFFGYVGVFLLLPTGIVIFSAFFTAAGQPTLENIQALTTSVVLEAFLKSILLSLISAVVGAGLGAVLAYMIASGPADGTTRRLWTAASGVLAGAAATAATAGAILAVLPLGVAALSFVAVGFVAVAGLGVTDSFCNW